jgi:glycosyltransferase involved in cell wall biosynthesis
VSKLKVLHVVTLGGPNGEYGGPFRVARELCEEHTKRGGSAQLLFGINSEIAPINNGNFQELAIPVTPLLRKYKVSSLVSLKIFSQLIIQIKKSELVHIHFGRDFISILAALIGAIFSKTIVLQTHGMLVPDPRRIVRILDLIMVLPVMRLADKILALSFDEQNNLSDLGISENIYIQPNGIGIPPVELNATRNQIPRVAFCGRLFQSKGIDLFLDIARRCHQEKLEVRFEIYGPDGGELKKIVSFIDSNNLSGFLKYLGPLPPHLVQETLANVDILVLPSTYDPYPMVVLEALSVGTCVVISNACGQAEIVRKIDTRFVPQDLTTNSFYTAIWAILRDSWSLSDRLKIVNQCREFFGIEKLYDEIEKVYNVETSDDIK